MAWSPKRRMRAVAALLPRRRLHCTLLVAAAAFVLALMAVSARGRAPLPAGVASDADALAAAAAAAGVAAVAMPDRSPAAAAAAAAGAPAVPAAAAAAAAAAGAAAQDSVARDAARDAVRDAAVGSGSGQILLVPERHRHANLAVALKTGRDVALERTPIQLLTFLSDVPNLIVIAEAPGVSVGAHQVIDVYSGMYAALNTSDPLAPLIAAEEAKRKANGGVQAPAHQAKDKNNEAVQVNQASLGWKADAHKNLPGYRELYRRFPTADWFIMIDDDTYFMFDNFQEHIKAYDPDEPLYFGAPTNFKDCDGVKKFGDGPKFAHGGSGIVLSRGAVKKLMSGLDACMVRYKTCWAGDVRTALCLRDQGILLLKNLTGFSSDPPSKKLYRFFEPCLLPISFHHLLVTQAQRMWDAESRLHQVQGRLMTMADVYKNWVGAQEEMLIGHDRRGGDYIRHAAEHAEDCVVLCQEDPKCVAYSFDGRTCWLKSVIPVDYPNPRVVSGVISSNYVCNKAVPFRGRA
ncbi:hypothetical protein HK105_207004 [Polyrhizophydium stewartii]|uniref:N-acetylgalactosaminide beta-1,3-galactosyltransferase n=1 Tax=Polyrhizophydium stewartii TaxID=2732419 RepID=A0ABR4N211_9FUNG